jgi:ankyrin repeat protein
LDSSLETYDFLLHRGVSPNYTSLGWGLLPFIWTPLMNSWSTDENYDRIRKMTNLAVQRSCDPNELVDHQNLLHWLGTLDLSLGLTALSEVCSYLVTIGCELEQKDTWSRTPLLAAAEKTSPDGLVALISKGANLGAVDFLGRGVFHLAFMGRIDSQNRSVPEFKLKETLETAILAGCDPNALDNSGFSPSDYSIWFGMWKTWTLVLNAAGFTPECIELEPRKETARIVLRKGADDSQTLPVSNLTIAEWIAKRNKANRGYTPLHTAAEYGYAETTNDLLNIGFDANYTSDQGQTPLHVAATRGNVNIAKQLHAKGAQLEAQTNNAVTPLYCAVNNRRLEFVTWLLYLDTNVNCADKNGWTPVHLAASSGQLNIAKQLYAKGAQLEAKTISGITPLYDAVNKGQFEIATWLLERNANPNCVNEKGWSPLHLAASEGHIDLAKQLATKGAHLNAQTKSGMSPLHQAVIKERSEIVTWLLEMGADHKSVTENGWTPLHIAASNGHFDIAKQLYAKGAPVDTQTKEGTTPLYQASCNGHFDLVVWLIQQNAKVNLSSHDGFSPLQVATERGHLEIAKHLYAHGGQIDTRTNQGYTLIHGASASGNSELIAWLIDLKLDVNCPTTAGWVPIHCAAERGHVATINQLVNFGANATAESDRSYTPLHEAAFAGHLAVVNRLLELGADPNHRSNVGSTPFHGAVYHGRIPVLEAFARTSGDPFLLDGFGRNVLDWASMYPPAFEALERFHESYEPTTDSASKSHLTATIQRLLSSAHNSDNWLNSLGRLLIFGGHDNDATTAFEQRILSDRGDSMTRHGAVCDMCEVYPIQSSRFVCRECADIDLCEFCMVRYQDGESRGACNKHTFLKVPSEAWKTLRASEVNEKGESLEEWLERLKDQWVGDQVEG